VRPHPNGITTASVTAVVLCLVFLGSPIVGGSSQVTNNLCSCATHAPVLAPRTMPPGHQAQPASAPAYDEQVGLTFTQDFPSLEYNVTAVEQTDPTMGDGPAYLLNGISNLGYWYQVGVSWDWSPGGSPGTGFNMNYEVYDNLGNSVFPLNGSGGLLAFSGAVNARDPVTLELFISSSSQSVTMLAKDPNTGAVASETYASMGATYFVGLPDSPSDPNGYFTGLMTEWYHAAPYYANEAEVVFSNRAVALSSAWMWIEEFDPTTSQFVFSANTSAPVSFSNPNRLLEFSYNGTTEYGDGHDFVTGALPATTNIPPGVPLTLSFTVRGGSGYSSPALTYVSNGTSTTTPMTTSPTIYVADPESTWTVSLSLNGSTPGQRWETDQETSAVASSSQIGQIVYYGQRLVVFGFSISGGGSGFSPPTIKYTSFGVAATASAGSGVWVDEGSVYHFQSVLSGSTKGERWYTAQGGSIGQSGVINATYYHQYLVTFDVSLKNTEILPGIALSSTAAGQKYSGTLIPGTNPEWLDSGSGYSVPQSISQGGGNRLLSNGSGTGEVALYLAVGLVYEHQFYVDILQNAPGGGTTYPTAGWYDSGSELQLNAVPAPGWSFEGWFGVGVDSESSSSGVFSMTVGPAVASNETALFYPGVTIDAAGPVSVSYSDGAVSGSVGGGATTEVYVPPDSTMTLTASNDAFLTAFNGWIGAVNSSNTQTSFVVESPAVVLSGSGYNYVAIGLLVAMVGAVAVVAALVLKRRRSMLGRAAPSPGATREILG